MGKAEKGQVVSVPTPPSEGKIPNTLDYLDFFFFLILRRCQMLRNIGSLA